MNRPINLWQISTVQIFPVKCFYKQVVLKNFAEFTRKLLYWCVWISFSDIPTQALFVNFETFLKMLFLQNIYERLLLTKTNPANIYLFIRRQWRHSDVIINFEHILHLFLVFLLLTLNKQILTGMWLGEHRFIWVCLTILWGWYLKD